MNCEVIASGVLYGHSVSDSIGSEREAVPPPRLFHGTSPAAWVDIQQDGLLPMSRRFVHMSHDPQTALHVGRRKSATPLVLIVDSAAARSAGITFHQGNEQVWLANHVPARFISTIE